MESEHPNLAGASTKWCGGEWGLPSKKSKIRTLTLYFFGDLKMKEEDTQESVCNFFQYFVLT